LATIGIDGQRSSWQEVRSRYRVERIWQREGLKVPHKQPKRSRLWLTDGSCIRLRPEYRNHVSRHIGDEHFRAALAHKHRFASKRPTAILHRAHFGMRDQQHCSHRQRNTVSLGQLVYLRQPVAHDYCRRLPVGLRVTRRLRDRRLRINRTSSRECITTLPAVRQAIVELIARLPPQRCPHCRKWICSEKQRE
jgi:hypothetical protein